MCVGFRQNACALFVAYNLLRMGLVDCGCDVWLVTIMEIRWLLECGWRARSLLDIRVGDGCLMGRWW